MNCPNQLVFYMIPFLGFGEQSVLLLAKPNYIYMTLVIYHIVLHAEFTFYSLYIF